MQLHDLKQRTIRGGLAKLLGQVANFALRLGFIVTLARFLDAADFGLVAMVTAVTGIFPIFASAGLSSAAVQQEHVTDAQISGLFWLNILVGAVLGILSVVIAPILCYFYQEPRLFWIMVAMSAGFVISAAGVQHNALLQRHLRYDELTAIEVLSQLLGIGVGITMAIDGFAYWALVGWTIVVQATGTVLVWLTAAWIPSRPRRRAGIRPLLRFGGTITLNILVVYIAYNFEKVLLGRFWGGCPRCLWQSLSTRQPAGRQSELCGWRRRILRAIPNPERPHPSEELLYQWLFAADIDDDSFCFIRHYIC